MKNYSNPRISATIENWPIGGGKRGPARFYIEAGIRKERAVRVTTGKPKKLTYALRTRIVDGDDGKTYILEDNDTHLSVMRGDMKYQEESIFPDAMNNGVYERNDRYFELKSLFSV